MAEVVEYRVGKTLDELNLLVEFGILTKHHAKGIVAKRENFEYTLRRRTRTKLDYLRYIKFEVNLLESLDKYRKTVLEENLKPRENKTDNDDIEKKILILQAKKLNDVIRSRCAHISSLFRKLTISFQFDKKLWLAYIEFAKSRKWNSRATALYWRLLRVCSDDPDIWLSAARHEVEVNKAYETARGLYLRALRHHPLNPAIWADYFKMEIDYMDVVDRRAQVVFKTLKGLKEDANEKDKEAQWAEDLEKSDDAEPDLENDGDSKEDPETVGDNEKLPVVTAIEDDAIISGQLPRVVYNNATDSLKTNLQYLEFIIRILSYLSSEPIDSQGFVLVKNDIIKSVKSQYDGGKDSRISKEVFENCEDESFLKLALAKLSGQHSCSPKRFKKSEPSRMELLYECYESKGILEARRYYEEMEKSQKHRTLSLYVGMIQIELWQLPIAKGLDQLNRIKKVYEKALIKFGRTKPKLWCEYLQFEIDNSKTLEDVKRINELYQRAQATLNPDKVGKLIEKYTLLQARSSKNDIEYSDYSELED